MSVEYEYDRESGSFRPVERNTTRNTTNRPPQKKQESDVGSWIWIGAMFAFGLWPIGLIMLINKLKDTPRRDYNTVLKEAQSKPKTETKAAQTVRKVTRTPDATSTTANALMITGAVVTFIFAIATMAVGGDYLLSGLFDDLLGTFVCGGFLAGGITMLFAGRRMKKRTKRIARYLTVIGERDYVSLDELSAIVGKRRKTVEDDLEYMIEKGMLGTLAYVDSGRGVLFRSAAAAGKYKAEKAGGENLTPKEANEGYAGTLRAIRYANDRIADPVLSEKIDHLETVAGRIFREIEQHPEKQAQASTFFSYYLPTTLKILNTYAEFDSAGIEGENLKSAKQKIEQTMDTLVMGFDKQLDDLYRNEAMDIDSEIRVMENMLKRDISSVEQDFGLGGAAVQRRPDEE